MVKLVFLLVSLCSADFIHPGGWHTVADIQRVRSRLAANQEPWVGAAEIVMAAPPSLDYQPQSFPWISTGDGNNTGVDELLQDTAYAYGLMLKWVITNNSAYADAVERILDSWSANLTRIYGGAQMITAGGTSDKLAQAAELLAYARESVGGVWPNKQRAQKWFKQVFYPSCRWFCGISMENCQECHPRPCIGRRGGNGNIDTRCMSGIISIAVFSEDSDLYKSVVEYWYNGTGSGALEHYILPNGQCQESSRDQGHTQGGIGKLLQMARVAHNQGLEPSLYEAGGARLLEGLEYTAKYNLNYSVPFVKHCIQTRERCGPCELPPLDKRHLACHYNISSSGRGEFSPIWEMVVAAYGSRAPYSKMVRSLPGYRPEKTGGDHPGYGTLMFYDDHVG